MFEVDLEVESTFCRAPEPMVDLESTFCRAPEPEFDTCFCRAPEC